MNAVRGGRDVVPVVTGADIVVVGSGAAGLATALALAPRPVTLLTKTATLAGGSTGLAQGGIAAALDAADSGRDHAADTIAAGVGLCDPECVGLLTREGPARIRELIAAGMRFDVDVAGRPALGREAAHCCHRIVHAGGDATGRWLQKFLIERVAATASITVVAGVFAWDLALDGGRVCGVLAHDAAHGWRVFGARHVVLATGGSGQLFRATTNPPEATADGVAMAARAGAALADLEFVQFHPTALADRRVGADAPMPLLTEALRGTGARLIDAAGVPLMAHHRDGDLAPRDVVARAVWQRLGAGFPVFLDARCVFNGPDAATRFPTIAAICRRAGLDPAVEPLPVMPAAHYHMGGIATDDSGRTSLPGLWACGEAAATGVHGANRLASNSLLEALVFGDRVAGAIAASGETGARLATRTGAPRLPCDRALAVVRRLRLALRDMLYDNVGLIRDHAGLDSAQASLEAGTARLGALPVAREGAVMAHGAVREVGETRNLLLVGLLIARFAREREESRGAHVRSDFPAMTSGKPRHSRLTLTDCPPQLVSPCRDTLNGVT